MPLMSITIIMNTPMVTEKSAQVRLIAELSLCVLSSIVCVCFVWWRTIEKMRNYFSHHYYCYTVLLF
jgi:hypothetical protein